MPATTTFGKLRLFLGTYSDLVVPVYSVSNTLPAVVTVDEDHIASFVDGYQVIIAGIHEPPGMSIANGTWTIASSNNPINTFTLTGVDCTVGEFPATMDIKATAKGVGGGVTYIAPCGFSSKSCTISKNLNEIVIPDCSQRGKALWLGRDVGSFSCSISGDGIAAASAVPYWAAAVYSPASVPMRVEIDFGVGNSVLTGLFHIDSQGFSAESGGRVTLSINAQSDGDCLAVWTPTP